MKAYKNSNGDIAILNKKSGYYRVNSGTGRYKMPKKAIERSSDWVQLNYLILSFKHQQGITSLAKDGTYCWVDDSIKHEKGGTLNWCLTMLGYEIESVKRLRDGKVIKLNDVCSYYGLTFVVSRIENFGTNRILVNGFDIAEIDSVDVEVKENDTRSYEVIAYHDGFNIYSKVNDSDKYTINSAHFYTEKDVLDKTVIIHAIKNKTTGDVFRVGENCSPLFTTDLFSKIEKIEPSGNTVKIWGNYHGMLGFSFMEQLKPHIPKNFIILESTDPKTGEVFTFVNGCCTSASLHLDYDKPTLAVHMSSVDTSKLIVSKIQRISDGETFAIGDRYELIMMGGDSVIRKIHAITIDGVKISIVDVDGSYSINDEFGSFDEMIKVKPEFTTEDGVDIYLNDKYFAIEKYAKGWTVVPYVSCGSGPNGVTKFSTYELAQESLFKYEECLSLNDICELFNMDEYYELTKLVKDKLSK